ADVVVGLDQYDISRATAELEWHEISVNGVEFDPAVRDFANMKFFVPYDWGPLAFMMRKGSLVEPASLDDLLKPEYRGQIALQDPRTSSPGLQFLNWVMRVKGPIDGEKFLRSLLGSVHSISPSWSTSIGLYNQKKASIVFTYATSPLYYLIEENSRDHTALRFTEPHPVQIELVGIPKFCRECDLAESFVTFLLSPEGQSIIMKKNYMLPVVPSVRAGTSFQDIFVGVPTLPVEVPTNSEVNDVLKRWSVILRESGS
ncbi:MAG: thiamine ABC transporter substrate-binding protein, partial [Bdellovibrionaceae bacterium]|nr:thiamine ABC transporter substrate-binding protein [Pseudobdellovibrionaceae bacterium]